MNISKIMNTGTKDCQQFSNLNAVKKTRKNLQVKKTQMEKRMPQRERKTTERYKSSNHFISLVNVAINILEMLSTG